jgi:predicted dehydrogenase
MPVEAFNTPPPANPIRCAIIGFAGYGRNHLRRLFEFEKVGDIKLVAALTRDPAEAPEEYERLLSNGCSVFTNADTMFREFSGKLDICLVCTSTCSHTRFTLAALEAGAHVFVEKPVTASIQEAREIKELGRRKNRFIVVGMQIVHAPEIHEMKKFLHQGGIGKLLRFKGLGLWPREENYYNRNDWAGKLRTQDGWTLDSPITNGLSHFLHLMLFLAGSTPISTAFPDQLLAETYRCRGIGYYDTGFLRLVTDNAIEVYYAATHFCRNHHNPIIFAEGSEGNMVVKMSDQHAHGYCKVSLRTGEAFDLPMPTHQRLQRNMMDSLFAHFRDRSKYVCTVDSAMAHTLCINGIYESSEVADLRGAFASKTDSAAATKNQEEVEIAVRTCFEEASLPSELGYGWAKPGTWVDLADYTHFPVREIEA